MSRLRWLILALGIAFMAFSGIWGTGVFDRLSGDASLDDPTSESQRISQPVTDALGRQTVDFIALYSSPDRTVDDPAFRRAVEDVVTKVRTYPEVTMVTSFYESQSRELVSTDEHSTYVPVRFAAGTKSKVVKAVRADLAAAGVATRVGGQKAIDLDIDSRIGPDIARAEMIAMPILFLLLIIVFGNLVAGLMPILVGGIAILGAFMLVRVITLFTDVSVFSINIITILGLGLAVDYGLFIVSRFREELDRGHPVDTAVSRTMSSAGRTVAVSGLIVGLSLCGLLIFPQILLRSMGLGGAAAVLVAMLTSLTVLPAMLAILGHRIDAGRLPLPWTRKRRVPTLTGAVATTVAKAADSGWWARLARTVMRRPVIFTVGVSAILLVLAAPFARVEFGGVDERVLPPGTESRVVSERLQSDFAGTGIRPIRVLVADVPQSTAAAFGRQLEQVPGVNDVEISAGNGTTSLLNVTYDGEANAPHARGIVEKIRALDRPEGALVMVGGTSASVVDQLDSLSSRLPWMALLIAGITFLLLALAFGSVVVPLKAIVMNLVSIGAAFGVVVWIFQDGHFSGLLNFTPTGYVEASQPVLMVAILFGLSMDYEVFLISRIRERYDSLGDNTAAVAAGVQRTGGIITTAAVLLCVVVGSFSTSGITFIKMVGVGMFVALVVDATLVRMLLVPATMRLLGRHNWWAPAPLRKAYARYGFRETDDLDEPAATAQRAPETAATR
ncbi:MMPL family transporter [Actinokineospora xionganensis]|uniref:MMPL family transporter n=1 Tax=Actinokineospora xionganensis TaxID=2684470 RepID=UPI001C9C45B3|nr:MMPL family transporter [Actinokineospora xionganensis]